MAAKSTPESPRQRKQNATNHVAAEITRQDKLARERKTVELRSKRLLKEEQQTAAAKLQ